MSDRVAFYPCCATDVAEPLELLRGFAEEVVFCDRNISLQKCWNQELLRLAPDLPRPRFVAEDVRAAVEQLPRIDVLFYRRDSDGEGGSGVFVLGDSFLWRIVDRFPDFGGRIVTDGSNDRGSNFKRMIRRTGLTKKGWHFEKGVHQPFFDEYGLYVIDVKRVSADIPKHEADRDTG